MDKQDMEGLTGLQRFIAIMFYMNQNSTLFAITLTVIMVVLKLTGVFTGIWVFVFIPIIARFALAILVLVVSLIISGIADLIRRR